MAFIPSPQQQAMGIELRERREALELPLAAVVAELGNFSVSKLSRLEEARHEAGLGDLNDLMRVLDIDSDTQQRLRKLRSINVDPETEWWREYRWVPGPFEQFLRAEAHAVEIWSSHGLVIPGLLETEAYVASLFETNADGPDSREEAVRLREEAARLRLRRQGILNRRSVKFHFLLGESVLSLGTPEILVPQLDRLIELANRSNIDLRVLPAASGVPVYAFDYMNFSFKRQIAFLDHPWTTELIEMGEVGKLSDVNNQLAKYATHALTAEETIQLIKRKKKDLT